MMRYLDTRAASALDYDAYATGIAAKAHVLDDLALAALEVALGQSAPPPLLADGDHWNDLATILTPEQFDMAPFRRRANRLDRAHIMTRPETADGAAARLISRQVPSGRPLTDLAFVGIAKLSRMSNPGRYGAETLAAALARNRWRAAPFRLHAAARLRDVLRQRVIFHPGPAPAPVLSTTLWWPLIHAYILPLAPERSAAALHDTVAAQARTALAEERCLGFWEVFLLRSLGYDAHAFLPRPIRDLTQMSPQDLIELPTEKVGTIKALRLDWSESVPAYAEPLLTAKYF